MNYRNGKAGKAVALIMFQVIPVNAMWWHVWLFSSLFLLIGILVELASSIAFRQDVGEKKQVINKLSNTSVTYIGSSFLRWPDISLV